MPIYVFECKNKKCKHVYEELTRWDETGKYEGVVCPKCGCKKKSQCVAGCNFIFAQPEGTSRWISDSTGHDYRYKHKQKDIRAEREAAEKASHMGSGADIYKPTDDLSNDKNWDFDKI